MPIENRKVTCDICGTPEWEERFGVGWPNWIIIKGIGAVAPEKDESIANKHLEMYICKKHKNQISNYLNRMQIEHAEWHSADPHVRFEHEERP